MKKKDPYDHYALCWVTLMYVSNKCPWQNLLLLASESNRDVLATPVELEGTAFIHCIGLNTICMFIKKKKKKREKKAGGLVWAATILKVW